MIFGRYIEAGMGAGAPAAAPAPVVERVRTAAPVVPVLPQQT
jgi:hypothetical protein